jgi:mono/diheme cytochrome c family protein
MAAGMTCGFRRLLIGVAVLGMVGGVFAYLGWYKFFREEPTGTFADAAERFKYGSLGGENEQGIPYWIFVVLPRMFPEYLPGPGGYAAFGLPWEEGHELPIGFTKRVVGFPRVANTCAVCHTASYRTHPDKTPHYVAAGPGHTSNIQALLRFFARCARDPRFNGANVVSEIRTLYGLTWLDRLLYRFIIVPLTKQRLIERAEEFAWMDEPGRPDWGPGRDDGTNLPKYFLIHLPVDDTIGHVDFPAIWRLRGNPEQLFNWDGLSSSVHTVIIDSALGLGAPPKPPLRGHAEWLAQFLGEADPPPFPFPIDATQAAMGAQLFARVCGACHAPDGPRLRRVIPIDEIGTDRYRLDSWTDVAATESNRIIGRAGVDRPPVSKTAGYIAPPLEGIWLRAPYLHNGSVPTLRDLLNPPAQRPDTFVRGYDLVDPINVGFDSTSGDASRHGSRFDTRLNGNGNGGHLYGTDLAPEEKTALIEYLKTL